MNERIHIAAETPEELLNELRSVIRDAEHMVQSSAAEHSREALVAIKEKISAVKERLAQAYNTSKQSVVTGARCTDQAIRKNPYESIAIAASLGLLIGFVVGRRSK